MVRDRLNEFLTREPSSDPRVHIDIYNGNVVILGMSMTPPKGQESSLEEFLREVGNAHKLNEKVKANLETIKCVQSKILCSPFSDADLQTELNQLNLDIKTDSETLRTILKEMRTENAAVCENIKGSAIERTRTTQYNALLCNFNALMNEYHNAQNDFRSGCRARIQRQFEIAEVNYSEEQVDELIEQGKFPGVTQSIILDLDTEYAKKILEDVEARHHDILKVEQAIIELHELFREIAFLVESQDAMISSIEENVNNSKNHVDNTRKRLKVAQKSKQRVRKKKILIYCLLASVVLLIILAFALYFIFRK